VDGAAEVAPRQVGEKYAVLHGQRPVEPELGPHPEDLAARRVRREQQGHRIAGQAHDDEDYRRDQPERDESAEEPVAEERKEPAHD